MMLPELPLLKRELIGLLRTRKAFWIVLLVLLLSSVIPLCNWPSHRSQWQGGYETLWIFASFFFAQLTAALFLVPAFTAGAISGERERDTYDSLYTTLLRPSSIVLSKASAATGFILLVLAFASPTAFVLFFLGGLQLEGILKCYVVLAAALIQSSIVCLYHSMSSNRTAHAAVRSYFWVLFWNGGLALLLQLCWGLAVVVLGNAFVSRPALEIIGVLGGSSSPYFPIGIEILEGGRLRGFSAGFGFEPYTAYLAISGLITLAHFLLLLRRARVPEIAKPRWLERRAARKARTAQTRPIRRSILTQALIRWGEKGVPILSNALFQKEIKAEFFGRLRYRRSSFWLSLLLFVGIMVAALGSDAPPQYAIAFNTFVALALIFLMVPSVAASGFPREREQGNLDFLRGTRLSAGEILAGKFWGAVYSGLGVFSAVLWTLPATIVISAVLDLLDRKSGSYWREDHWLPGTAIVSVLVLTISLLFAAAISTTVSAFAKRSLSSLGLTFFLILSLLVLWPMFLGIIGFHQEMEDLLSVTHPFVAAGEAIFERWDKAGGRLIGFVFCYSIAIGLLWVVARGRAEMTHGRDA